MREMLDPLTTQMNIELDAFEARINNNDELKELIVATKIRDADNEDLSSDESKLLENLNSVGVLCALCTNIHSRTQSNRSAKSMEVTLDALRISSTLPPSSVKKPRLKWPQRRLSALNALTRP